MTMTNGLPLGCSSSGFGRMMGSLVQLTIIAAISNNMKQRCTTIFIKKLAKIGDAGGLEREFFRLVAQKTLLCAVIRFLTMHYRKWCYPNTYNMYLCSHENK